MCSKCKKQKSPKSYINHTQQCSINSEDSIDEHQKDISRSKSI